MGFITLLAPATAAGAAALISDTEATALVAAVRSTTDADLQTIIDRDEIRDVAIEALVARIGDFALADELAGIDGRARIEFVHQDQVCARVCLQVTGGAIATASADDEVDVTLRTTVLGLLRLVSGERNAGMEFLCGRLGIDGDAELALALGGIFPAPAVDGAVVPVDPRALDTVEVARELTHVDIEHLRKVMASGFRPVVLDEIFGRLPEFVNQQKSRGLRIAVGFRLTGRTDGMVDRFVVRLDGGAAEVLTGAEADAVGRDDRSATVTCGAHDFLRLATGHLSPVTGVLRGQLKVRGDKAAALRLAGAFDIPTAVAGWPQPRGSAPELRAPAR